jgi:hydroxymethylglutaryl-CoA synthase
MPELAMKRLLQMKLGLEDEAAAGWLRERGFFDSVDPIADVGNSYSASMYLFLASALRERRQRLGDAIVGKRFLLASYGSGNVMAVVGGKVSAGAPAVIDAWGGARPGDGALAAGMEEYDRWVSGYGPAQIMDDDGSKAGAFRLTGIREDGYREYEHVGERRDQRT